MLSTTDQADLPSAQQNSSSLQQPRTDLQPSTDSTASQTGQSSSFQPVPSLGQDQLSTNQLRVGSSDTLIQNSTSITPQVNYHHNYLNAGWLWLAIPIALAAFLFWPQKRGGEVRQQAVEPVAPAAIANPELVLPKKQRGKKRSKKK